MKYLKGFVDSVYLSYLGWFGERLIGKELYTLWTIHVNGDVSFSLVDCNIQKLRVFDPLLHIHWSNK